MELRLGEIDVQLGYLAEQYRLDVLRGLEPPPASSFHERGIGQGSRPPRLAWQPPPGPARVVISDLDVPNLTARDRHEVSGRPGFLSEETRPSPTTRWILKGSVKFWIGAPFRDVGMDTAYWCVPSQHPDPLRAMEHQCRWMCTQPRQNLKASFDKARYYKYRANYEDTALNRRLDASGRRDRSLERFSNRLWNGPIRRIHPASWNSADISRLLTRAGLNDVYRSGGLDAIGQAVNLTRRQLEVFTLYATMTQEQIAAEIGITQAAVSFRLTGATERCRRWVAGQNLIPLHLSVIDGIGRPLSPVGPGGHDGERSRSAISGNPLLRFLCALMDRTPVPTAWPVGSEVPFIPWQGPPLPWVREQQAQITAPLRLTGHRAAVLFLFSVPVLSHHFVVWPDFEKPTHKEVTELGA